MAEIYNLLQNVEGSLYGLAAFAYLMLAILLLIAWRRSGPGTWLVFACLTTVIWAALSSVSSFVSGFSVGHLTLVLESTRTLAWTGFIYSIFSPRGEGGEGDILRQERVGKLPMVVSALIIVVSTGLVAIGGADFFAGGNELQAVERGTLDIRLTLYLAVSIGILLLLEMLLRYSSSSYRAGIRNLVIALGGQTLFDILLFVDALFTGGFTQGLLVARPGVIILVAPFLFIAASRNSEWKLNISMSRRGAVYSFTLIGIGLYLILMSLAALFVSQFGGTWGDIGLTLLLFAAGLFLVALVSSWQVRRWFRRFISEHFLAYTYDYREEWLKFVRTVSEGSGEGLRVRIIRAMAGLVDSPGGSLWMADRSGALMRQVDVWEFEGGVPGVESMDSEFAAALARENQVLDIDLVRDPGSQYSEIKTPEWARQVDSAWLAVPLVLRDCLIGMVILERPPGPASLNWEERDILMTVATQSASYLSEHQAQATLAESQQFRDFSERFAFAMHDIKNVSSQMGLLVQNADKHIDKPAFQQDMLSTLSNMTEKMKLLLARLDDQKEIGLVEAEDVELGPLLGRVVRNLSGGPVKPGLLDDIGEPVWATVEPEQVERVIGHLVQNALDAVSKDDGKVRVELTRSVQFATIRVRDNGVGMSPEFMAKKLFKPFHSTKENGYGLGMVECRRVINRHKGELRVASSAGKGTLMEVRLPLSIRSMEQGSWKATGQDRRKRDREG